jgi:hypothetical protein
LTTKEQRENIGITTETPEGNRLCEIKGLMSGNGEYDD